MYVMGGGVEMFSVRLIKCSVPSSISGRSLMKYVYDNESILFVQSNVGW